MEEKLKRPVETGWQGGEMGGEMVSVPQPLYF